MLYLNIGLATSLHKNIYRLLSGFISIIQIIMKNFQFQFILVLLIVLLSSISYSQDKTGAFIDIRDNHVYKWVLIGDQVWMSENLAYLPAVNPPTSESTTEPYYYVYGYNGTSLREAKATVNYSNYGVLYNWPAAMKGAASSNANPSGVQGVCPAGWHLPSNAEWNQLTHYLGSFMAGDKLKESGTVHWKGRNYGATNSSGFTALPGGYRYDYLIFGFIGYYGRWWSATEFLPDKAWKRGLSYNTSNVFRDYNNKEFGFSVRCVRDN
jgi:uncharacterized protein (TIGR02145 family)